jgi:hypothetical protein
MPWLMLRCAHYESRDNCSVSYARWAPVARVFEIEKSKAGGCKVIAGSRLGNLHDGADMGYKFLDGDGCFCRRENGTRLQQRFPHAKYPRCVVKRAFVERTCVMPRVRINDTIAHEANRAMVVQRLRKGGIAIEGFDRALTVGQVNNFMTALPCSKDVGILRAARLKAVALALANTIEKPQRGASEFSGNDAFFARLIGL